jgi:hypothetical protein
MAFGFRRFILGCVFIAVVFPGFYSWAQQGPSLFPEVLTAPRHAGKPDPRWRRFDWKFIDRSSAGAPYRFYFYPSEEWAARFTIPRIDDQVARLVERFGEPTRERFSYLLFTSLEEFRQANIFFVEEGVRGITSTEEATMVVPYTGDPSEFDHVSLHEMVHQFQTQIARRRAGGDSLKALAAIPLWFIEGMAEFESLGGMDAESRMYLRDLVENPNPRQRHVMPDFFESGPRSFVFTYKVGQAKIHFLESRFGDKTSHRILTGLLESLGVRSIQTIAQAVTAKTPEEIEAMWRQYVEETYAREATVFTQTAKNLEEVPEAGEDLDLFAVSPDGSTIAIREIDPLTGVTSINLMRSGGGKKLQVARDRREDALSLYFMDTASLAISNDRVVYFVQTPDGAQLEWKTYGNDSGRVRSGRSIRVSLERHDIRRAGVPAIHPDGKLVAFAGLNSDGRENIHLLDIETGAVRRITEGASAWRSLSWFRRGERVVLLGSSNRISPARFDLFTVDPDTAEVQLFHSSGASLQGAEGGEVVVFQSMASGSQQIHRLSGHTEVRLTGLATSVSRPALRGETLYFLGFRSGRNRLYRMPMSQSANVVVPVAEPLESASAWIPKLAEISAEDAQSYQPFRVEGFRVDQLGAFLSGNTSGIVLQVSDLMRDYQGSALLISPDNPDYNLISTQLTSRRGRSSWSAGLFRSTQPRLDNVIFNNGRRRVYRHSEWGVLGAWQYPVTIFSAVGIGGRVASVRRSQYSDVDLADEWERQIGGSEWLVSPAIWYGRDRILYEPFTGPIQGTSLLLEAATGYFPDTRRRDTRYRLDLAAYQRLFRTRTVLALQALAGASFGDVTRDPFFIWSDDIMRAYVFGDRRLIGNFVAVAKAELRFPVGTLFGFPNLRGVAAFDYGTIAREWDEAEESLASSWSYGGILSLPPIALEFVQSHPIETAPGPVSSRVLHFRLRYLYE